MIYSTFREELKSSAIARRQKQWVYDMGITSVLTMDILLFRFIRII